MHAFRMRGVTLPPDEFGIPPADPSRPPSSRGKSRWGVGDAAAAQGAARSRVGLGRSVAAGGMAWVSAVGPVDPDTGECRSADIRKQTRQCLENVSRYLATLGSSFERVVWATWSLREPSDFDAFYEEWLRWTDGQEPVGQSTIMPQSQRRAGFRVSVGVIAATQDGAFREPPTSDDASLIPALRASRPPEGNIPGPFVAGQGT